MKALARYFLTATLGAVPALTIFAAPLAAQDYGDAEIIVTGSRLDAYDEAERMPAVGLRRKADFLIQPVVISGDTREPKRRAEEIRAMLLRAIEAAQRSGLQLAQGNFIVTNLTPANAKDIELADDRRRPDTEQVTVLVKSPLANVSVGDAQKRIKNFIESVPEVGRAQMDAQGDPTLSVVAPDQYRDAIIDIVAADAKKQAARLGSQRKMKLRGLNMPVEWTRAGPGEVLLYIPYEMELEASD